MKLVRHGIVGVSAMLAVGSLAPGAAAATVDIATHKDNVTLVDEPDTANPDTNPDNMLNGWDLGLSYMAFDLSALPSGAQITDASVTVADMRTSRDQNVKIDFMDVPADWVETGEGALTWNIATADYGALYQTSSRPAGVDTSKRLWEGNFLLDAATQGDLITSTTNEWSDYTDSDLIDGLNAELTDGDGLAVFALRGTVGVNNYVAAREHATASPATLNLSYVPEPASLGVLGLGSLLLAGRRRRTTS